jgi:HD-like signal output (HDOD) protein
MKRRILFVDDETMILQGIERMLRPMRNEWQMDFVSSAEKARERMENALYDVIVTDLVMPAQDGAQLLSYVKERFPTTIRLVLSGHAEETLAMKCVGIAHQYLAKPCDPAMLKSTILRVTAPEFGIRNERVMTLVTQLEGLPTIPAVYIKMLDLLDRQDSSLDEIGAMIARDMALTAKLLQTVNSSFFGIARRISKPSEAAGFLGMDTLKTLVTVMNLFTWLESNLAPRFSVKEESDHSRQVGAAARVIALVEQCPRAMVDDSLAAGLLHDIGKLVLASSLPEQFGRVVTLESGDPLDAEREAFGATHADVGGYLLGLWGLPAAVVEAVNLHHSPRESQTPGFSALTAVHVANCLVREYSSHADHNPRASADLDYLDQLGLADRLPIWRLAVEDCLCGPQNHFEHRQ